MSDEKMSPKEIAMGLYDMSEEEAERMLETNQRTLRVLERIALGVLERTELEAAFLAGDSAPALSENVRKAVVSNGGMVLFQILSLLASECSDQAAREMMTILDHVAAHLDGTADQG